MFADHCAVNNHQSNGISLGNLGLHDVNAYHVLIGLAGYVKAVPYLAVILATGVPQLESKLNVYSFLS